MRLVSLVFLFSLIEGYVDAHASQRWIIFGDQKVVLLDLH